MIRLLKRWLRNRWHALLDAGRPWDPVAGVLYESPSMAKPPPDYSHIYRARMRAERERLGLAPLKALED